MKQPDNRFIAPACNFITDLGNQLMIATHIERSTTALKNTPALLEATKKLLNDDHKTLIKQINFLQQDTIGIIDLTKNIIANDFSKTNGQILVSMWNLLLTTVEDTLTRLLLKTDVRQTFFNVVVNIKQSRKDKLINETDEDVLREFVTNWYTPGNNKIEYIESQLAYFDLAFDMPSGLKTELLEMHQIRNCLVHRAGIVDKKLKDEAPTLNLEIGQTILVNKDLLQKYYNAAGQYGKLFLTKVLTSKYFEAKT